MRYRYENLNELIKNSKSSARFFFSLSPELQIKLGERGRHIRNAQELHEAVFAIQALDRAIMIADGRHLK